MGRFNVSMLAMPVVGALYLRTQGWVSVSPLWLHGLSCLPGNILALDFFAPGQHKSGDESLNQGQILRRGRNEQPRVRSNFIALILTLAIYTKESPPVTVVPISNGRSAVKLRRVRMPDVQKGESSVTAFGGAHGAIPTLNSPSQPASQFLIGAAPA